MTKRAIFVGRFCPFHKGHLAIMQKKIDEGVPLLILVRDTPYDIYPAKLRVSMIERSMRKLKVDAKVMIIDDIESVNYGRGVGYQVNEIKVDKYTQCISATDIRKKIDNNDKAWKNMMAPGAAKVLEDYLGEKGTVVWLTGLPQSGKSTIASLVADKLRGLGKRIENLDSSVVRKKVGQELGFSKADRSTNLRRAAFISKLLARNGVIVLNSFITPFESIRKEIREEIQKEANFIEVFVKCPVSECKKRDTKGLYKKAEKGEIKNFTGVSSKFETPKKAEVIIDTKKMSPEECAQKLIDFLDKNYF